MKTDKTPIEIIQDEVVKAAYNSGLEWVDIRAEKQVDLWPFVCRKYADQQLKAYKAKLKEKINEISQSPYDDFESNDNISADRVIEFIDTTTP